MSLISSEDIDKAVNQEEDEDIMHHISSLVSNFHEYIWFKVSTVQIKVNKHWLPSMFCFLNIEHSKSLCDIFSDVIYKSDLTRRKPLHFLLVAQHEIKHPSQGNAYTELVKIKIYPTPASRSWRGSLYCCRGTLQCASGELELPEVHQLNMANVL